MSFVPFKYHSQPKIQHKATQHATSSSNTNYQLLTLLPILPRQLSENHHQFSRNANFYTQKTPEIQNLTQSPINTKISPPIKANEKITMAPKTGYRSPTTTSHKHARINTTNHTSIKSKKNKKMARFQCLPSTKKARSITPRAFVFYDYCVKISVAFYRFK